MRKFNYISAAVLIFLTACATSANSVVTWKEDGLIENNAGKKVRLEIQGIYDALDYSSSTYLAGFKIDKNGENFPYIAKINDDLLTVKYWSFEKIPNDIFIYQKYVHLVNTEGEVYKLENSEWKLINLKLPPDSQIVYSDHNRNQIVCYPASLAKSESRESGCLSLGNHWQKNFVWHTKIPKMCDGKLYVVVQEAESNIFKKIDITTGKELASGELVQLPEDLCSL